MRQTLVPWFLWAVIAIGAILVVMRSGEVQADPRFQAKADGVEIVLHSDKCAVKEIGNLPNRATWHEGGKATEGCWGGHPEYPVVVLYFADRTVVILHKQAFSKAVGI